MIKQQQTTNPNCGGGGGGEARRGFYARGSEEVHAAVIFGNPPAREKQALTRLLMMVGTWAWQCRSLRGVSTTHHSLRSVGNTDPEDWWWVDGWMGEG